MLYTEIYIYICVFISHDIYRLSTPSLSDIRYSSLLIFFLFVIRIMHSIYNNIYYGIMVGYIAYRIYMLYRPRPIYHDSY